MKSKIKSLNEIIKSLRNSVLTVITIFLIIFIGNLLNPNKLFGVCCYDINISTEITEDCCVLIHITNPTCLLGEAIFLIQQYDSQSSEYHTEYSNSTSRDFSYKLCPKNGETFVQYRVRVATITNTDWPYCNGNYNEWIEGWTEYTGSVDLTDCCNCPSTRSDWLKLTVQKNRNCPDNGCLITLLDLDIPPQNACYTNYQVDWGNGIPLTPVLSIANDPIYNHSLCMVNNSNKVIRVYLFKNGSTNIDSACTILKIVPCRDDTPTPDTTTNICTPDCFNNTWSNEQTKWVEVPKGTGCQVEVKYKYRLACPPMNYQDLQVLQITTYGCPTNMTDKEIYQSAVKGLAEVNPMGFKPIINEIGCDTMWRIVKTDCWRNLYSLEPPDFTHPFGKLVVTLQQCDTGQCCVQRYTVCRDASNNITMTPNGFYPPNNNLNDCIFMGEMILPFIGPDGQIIGPLNPDNCYSTCDWVLIENQGPPLIPEKVSVEGFENVIQNSHFLKIECNNDKRCDVLIEYFDLQGNKIQTYNKVLSNSDNEFDISAYISQTGIFVYRIYINNIIYKTGKLIK